MRIAFIFLSIIVSNLIYAASPVQVAVDHWPPLINDGRDGGELRGLEVNIIKELFKRADVKYKFVICPWTRCLSMAKHGKIGFLTHVSMKDERKEFLEYLTPPYYTKDIRVFVMRIGEGHKIKKFEDLYKFKLGAVQDIFYGEKFDKELKAGKFDIMIGNENRDFLQLLMHKRIDAFIDSEIMVKDQIKRDNLTSFLEYADYKITTDNLMFFALAKRSVSKEQTDRILRAYQSMIQDGTVNRMVRE